MPPLRLSCDDLVCYLGEVGPEHVGTLDERVEGLPGDESGGATSSHSPSNIPGVGRNEAQLAVMDL